MLTTVTNVKIDADTIVVTATSVDGSMELCLTPDAATVLLPQLTEAIEASGWVEPLNHTETKRGLDVWVMAVARAAERDDWADLRAYDLPRLCAEEEFRVTKPNFAALFDLALTKDKEL